MLLLGEMIPGEALWAELEVEGDPFAAGELTGIIFPGCEAAGDVCG